MATLFENIPLNGIRAADLSALHSILTERIEDGCYYGNREQYYERLERLEKWLGDAVRYAYSEGVKMPKALPRDNSQLSCRSEA